MRVRAYPTDRLEKEALLMPADVPARVATWTGWLLLALFAAAIVFACTVRLPETVAASFVLEPGSGGDPRVHLSIPEPAFARLETGQEVRLHYHAYPYQRFGSALAVLQQMTPATVDGRAGPGLSGTAILKAGPAGHRIEPQPGMRGEARVTVGRRTPLQRVLDPLRGTAGKPQPSTREPEPIRTR